MSDESLRLIVDRGGPAGLKGLPGARQEEVVAVTHSPGAQTSCLQGGPKIVATLLVLYNRDHHEILPPDAELVHASIKFALLAFFGETNNKTKTKQNTKQRFLYMNSCQIQRLIIW